MGPSVGPPLNIKRCASLKWADSKLNSLAADDLARPVSTLGDLRDGATLVVRSAVRAARGPPAEPAAKASAKAGAAAKARSGASAPRPLVLSGAHHKERSLVIEVAHPEGCDVGGEENHGSEG